MSYGQFDEDDSILAHETPRWWAPIANGDLVYGDVLYAIDDLPYTLYARKLFADAYQQGRSVTLSVIRKGESQPISVTTIPTKFTFAEFLDIKLPELLVGLVFWLLALIVLRARPDSATNRVFAMAAACVAIHRLTAVSSVLSDRELFVNLPKMGHMMAAGLIGPLLVHLSILFPTPRNWVPPSCSPFIMASDY